MSSSPSELQDPDETEASLPSQTAASSWPWNGRWAFVILKLDAVAIWLVD